MKKLSLILALMLVLSCALFAACGGDEESSAADSSAASSEAASSDVESSEASSEAASSDVESSEVSDDSSAPALDAGDNIASGKAYTTSELFRQDDSWQWNPDSPIAYPDEDGKSMTDGILAPEGASYDNAAWAGFHSQGPDYLANGYDNITVDLGASSDMVKFAVNIATTATGAGGPQTVEIYVSADGENWGDAVATITALNPADAMTEYLTAELSEAVSGQYVQFRLYTTGYWMHIAEVEVYAPAA
ncbi:MAG: discoidin domain-containing protein [Clostridia bacterium]|nr:discoidin domain-containing protein [Clostridia bacterium]